MGVGPLNQRLEKLATKLGASEQIISAGKVSYADLPAHYNAASIFAMPARTRGRGLDIEGLGIAYLETQACGVPAIAGKSGGAPGIVIDGGTDIAVSRISKCDIVTGLVKILGDSEHAAVMGACGRKHVVRSWTWEIMTTQAHRILRTCVIPL